jgi:hypothetical protein
VNGKGEKVRNAVSNGGIGRGRMRIDRVNGEDAQMWESLRGEILDRWEEKRKGGKELRREVKG